MNWPRIRFVASPKPGARVLFDFNDDGSALYPKTWPLANGFTLGEASLSGTPGAVGRVYGNRTPKFTLVVAGSKADTVTVLNRLARELIRRESYLEMQLSESQSAVWFHTYAADPGGLSFDEVYDDETRAAAWQADISLPADAWAEGESKALPVKALSNNPATGGCFYELPPIDGDAPTPLTISVRPGAAWNQRRVLMSCFPVMPDAVRAAPVVYDASQFTASGSTGAVTAGAQWFGAGARRVDFNATPASATRLTLAAGTPPPAPGRYSVFVRVAATTADTEFAISFDGYNYSAVEFPAVGVANATRWLSMGDFMFPNGLDTTAIDLDDYADSIDLRISAVRLAGAGNLDINGVMLLPVETVGSEGARTLITRPYGVWDFTSRRTIWDGTAETLRQTSLTGGVISTILDVETSGAFLTADPKSRNFLALLLQTGMPRTGLSTTDEIAETTELTISYRPRYLWMAGDL